MTDLELPSQGNKFRLPVQEIGKGFHSTAPKAMRTISKMLTWGVDQGTTHCRLRVESPTQTQLPSAQQIEDLRSWLDKMPAMNTISIKIASDWGMIKQLTPEVAGVAQLLGINTNITKMNLLSCRCDAGFFQALNPHFATALVKSIGRLQHLAIDLNSLRPDFDIRTCCNLTRVDFLGHFHTKSIASLPTNIEALSANTMYSTAATEFSGLTRLTALSFSLVTRSLANCLRGVTALQELHVELGPCDDLHTLSSHSNLRVLSICAPYAANLDVLRNLPHLVDLGIRCSCLTSLAFLADATALTCLRIHELSWQALLSIRLPQPSQLHTLILGHPNFMQHHKQLCLISTIDSLEKLDLSSSVGLHGERLLPLASLTRLSALNLSHSVALSVQSVGTLVNALSALQVLALHGCGSVANASFGSWTDTEYMMANHSVKTFT